MWPGVYNVVTTLPHTFIPCKTTRGYQQISIFPLRSLEDDTNILNGHNRHADSVFLMKLKKAGNFVLVSAIRACRESTPIVPFMLKPGTRMR